MAQVAACYARELEAKREVLSLLARVAADMQASAFTPTEDLENQLKVHLVLWMLEPEIDLDNVQVTRHSHSPPLSLPFALRS